MNNTLKNLIKNFIVSSKKQLKVFNDKFVLGAGLVTLLMINSGCATTQSKDYEETETVQKTENGYTIKRTYTVHKNYSENNASKKPKYKNLVKPNNDQNIEARKFDIDYSTMCSHDIDTCYYKYNNWTSPKPDYKKCYTSLTEPVNGVKCNSIVYFYSPDNKYISFACDGKDYSDEIRTVTGTIKNKNLMVGEKEYKNTLQARNSIYGLSDGKMEVLLSRGRAILAR